MIKRGLGRLGGLNDTVDDAAAVVAEQRVCKLFFGFDAVRERHAGFAERLRNSGRVKPVIFFVMNIESGTVKTNTSTSVGEMESIMMSAPMTVTALANTCTTGGV